MNIIQKFKRLYIKEQFNPTFIGLFINPFYFTRKGLYKNIIDLSPNLNGKLLDIGCGTKPYRDLFKVDGYIGLEIDDKVERNNKYADVLYDGKIIPFQNDTFDSILLTQVFEHVFNPNEFLKEVNRVTKIGGKLLITVPFVWDEHEQPYDYARYSFYGLNYILKENGFEIIEHRKSCNGLELFFQLFNCYIYKIFITQNIYIRLIIQIACCAPFPGTELYDMIKQKISEDLSRYDLYDGSKDTIMKDIKDKL